MPGVAHGIGPMVVGKDKDNVRFLFRDWPFSRPQNPGDQAEVGRPNRQSAPDDLECLASGDLVIGKFEVPQ